MRYENVDFRWWGSDEDPLEGEVVIRETAAGLEMVLGIGGGSSQYLIVGRVPKGETYFVGMNSAGTRTNKVKASWAKVEEFYVGTWNEKDNDYLFSFALPQTQIGES